MFKYENNQEKISDIRSIIEMEWNMFQKVNNIGGRASCQNNFNTFNIMRFCQFSSWNDFMLQSYKNDLKDAISKDRNLITEKYAWMMEFTDPEYFRDFLVLNLPEIDLESHNIIEEITSYLMECEIDMQKKFPKFLNQGRPLNQVKNGFTSVDSYITGELKTYSKDTLKHYLDYVRLNRLHNINMVYIIQDATAKVYGYSSIEDAESKL